MFSHGFSSFSIVNGFQLSPVPYISVYSYLKQSPLSILLAELLKKESPGMSPGEDVR